MSAYDTNSVFPLLLHEDSESSQSSFESDHKVNFSSLFLKMLFNALRIQYFDAQNFPTELTHYDIFNYLYAVLHSPTYRSRYSEFLKLDFPRIPLVADLEFFHLLANKGQELIALHLLESKKLNNPICEFIGRQNHEIEKISWSRNTVWIDKKQTIGFSGVSEEIWNFHVGGYQVCDKWLKDRKGRQLVIGEIIHYQKVVVALSETVNSMKEIDDLIEKFGGWPKAFVSVVA